MRTLTSATWMPPREIQANLEWRHTILTKANTDGALQAVLLAECAENVEFFIDGFVWTYDPRLSSDDRTQPMILYDYQREGLAEMNRCIDQGEDLFVEKSRDAGFSWTFLANAWQRWRWQDGFSAHIGSHKEEVVDKRGDLRTHFERLRFIMRHLPVWMLPAGYRPDLHDKHMGLINPENGAAITGESANEDFSRQGRYSVVFPDEFAMWAWAAAAWQATADATNCRIVGGTPKGRGTKHARLRFGDDGETIRVLRWHWSQHPDKKPGLYTTDPKGNLKILDENYQYPVDYPFVVDAARPGHLRSPWYDQEAERRSKYDLAQEVDIDYHGAGHAFFDYDVTLRLRLSDARPPVARGEVLSQVIVEPDGREHILVDRFVEGHGRRRLRLWQPLTANGCPNRFTNYAVGCDISEGVGASNSVASFIDVTTRSKVAEYVDDRSPPEQFARDVVALCLFFAGQTGGAYLAWEQNGPGINFGREVLRLGYTYIYWARNEMVDRARPKKARIPGWPKSRESALAVFGDYRRALERGELINPSEEALEETTRYVTDENGWVIHQGLVEEHHGARAAHGDRVVADAVAFMASKQQPGARSMEKRIPPGSFADRQQKARRRLREREDD